MPLLEGARGVGGSSVESRIGLIAAALRGGNIVFHSRTSAGQILSQGTDSDNLNGGQTKYITQSSLELIPVPVPCYVVSQRL